MNKNEKPDLTSRINKIDSIVYSVINKFTTRAEIGYKKYKTNMDRTDLTIVEWIDHSIEEKMDDIIYMEKIKHELLNKNYNNISLNSGDVLSEKKRSTSFEDLKNIFGNLLTFGSIPSEK